MNSNESFRDKPAADVSQSTSSASNQSTSWYDKLLDSISDIVVVLDRELRHIYVNEAASRMSEMSPDEILGTRIQELFPGVQHTPLFSALQDVLQSGEPRTIIHQLGPAGQKGRWFDDRLYPTDDGILVIGSDITERKRMVDSFSASEERFRTLFEQSLDAIFLVKPDGTAIEANQAWLDLFGYTREELPHINARDTYAVPAERDSFLGQIHRDGVVRDEVRLKRKDGTVFDCERHVVALKDSSEEIVSLQGVHRDVTERKRAVEEVRRSEAFTKTVLDSLPIGVAVNSVEPGVTFEYMNDNFARIYRTTREALSTPDAFWDAVYEDHEFRKQLRKRVTDDCASGDPERMHWEDVPITRKGEDATYINARNVPIPEKGLVLSTVWDVTERKRAEQALSESEGRFRTLFDHSIDAIFIATADGHIIEANQAWLDMFQYTRDDLAHLNASALHPSPSERTRLLDAMTEKGAVRDEALYKRKDGAVFPVRRTVVGIKDETGTVVLYQGIIYDVTELQQTEEREKEQRVLSEALMETSPACVVVFDVNRRVIFANAETDRVLGIPSEQVVGSVCGEDIRLLDMDGESVSDEELPACRVFTTEAPMYSVEYKFDSPTGRRILSVSAAPLYDDAGSVARVVATIEDVTEARHREQYLTEAESRYRGLFERSPEMVILTDPEGRIIDANPATVHTFGYPKEQVVGIPVWEYAAPGDQEVARKMVFRIFNSGELPGLLPFRVMRHDGSVIHAEVNASPVLREGVPVGVEIVARDVTERRHREQEQEESMARLRQAMNATVQAMTAAVEMRDPYTAGHQLRVTTVACAIAGELGMNGEPLQALTLAGQVHDLGKIRVPTEILTKPGRITDTEYRLIQEHPQASFDLLKGIDFPWPVAEIAHQHHERLDGSGYPQGLTGDQMKPEARILAVADVYEAMASHRPYRAALGMDAALEELEAGKGTLYDADAVDALGRLVREKGFRLE